MKKTAVRNFIIYTDNQILVGKPEEKRSFRRPRHRWTCNIKMNIKEMNMRMWTGFIWLRRRTSGRLL